MKIVDFNSEYFERLQRLLETYDFGLKSNNPKLQEHERKKIIATTQKKDIITKISINESDINGVIQYKKLGWDTEFFGFNCASLVFLYSKAKDYSSTYESNNALLAEFNKWLEQNKIKFTTVKTAEKDTVAINALADSGFNYIETVFSMYYDFNRVDYIQKPKKDVIIRPVEEKDISYLQYVSTTASLTRFHTDPDFDKSLIEKYRKTWIKNLCKELADEVFVAEIDNKAVGFVTCNAYDRGNIREGNLKLIAVDPDYRGRGIGKTLVQRAMNWFKERCDVVYISTQAKNTPSINMYISAGLRVAPSLLTFHKWN